MTRIEYLSDWSKVHGFPEGNEVSGIARIYLSLNFYLVQPLILLRIGPNLVTLLAPLLAGCALLVDANLAIAALVLGSLMVDGFDGAVALIRKKSTKFGGVWDGIVDRLTEFLWIASLYHAGIWPALLLVVWILSATQEYGRAKLTQIAGAHLGVVTICERPVRGLLVAFGFLGQIYFARSLELVAVLWLALQGIALIQFIANARRRLR